MHPDRACHQFIVKEMLQAARCRLPAHMAYLARADVAIGIAVLLGRVVVKTGIGPPLGLHMGIKGPVRQVDAFERIGQRRVLELVGGKPAAAIPFADQVAHLPVADLERQQALRRDRIIALFMRLDRRGAAKVAA